MKSLHEQHGKKAIGVLQGMMKQNLPILKGFDIVDNGNHFIISKGKKSMHVGLYASSQVFEALNTFCK